MAQQQTRTSIFDINLRARTVGLVSLAVLATLLAFAPTAQAQTYQVLHNFIGGADETNSQSGLTIDQSGHLYGTTIGQEQCIAGCGTVYQLSHQGSGWILSTIYAFRGGQDGSYPVNAVTLASDGSLYGTTSAGGVIGGCFGSGCGTVYHLQPPAAFCHNVTCPWDETVLYRFQGCPDLSSPNQAAFDQAGNIFGATYEGGFGCPLYFGDGGIFKLSPSQGGWSYQFAYHFMGELTGCNPLGDVVVDQSENIYGTTYMCGLHGEGAVYQVSPLGSGWREQVLHHFGQTKTDGAEPFAGMISDTAGNLYGTTAYGGSNGSGTVFELSPANGGYTYSVLYNFSGGVGSTSRLSMDSAGNLYGVQYGGGANNQGMVFKLTSESGGWTLTDLHDFDGSGGSYPIGQVALDANGIVYGTTNQGGAYGNGVVWEITP